MVEARTVRCIAGGLPEARDKSTSPALRGARKGFRLELERAEPTRPRRPRLDILVVRCLAEAKDAILSADPDTFVTDDHDRGLPAVLVRLDRIAEPDLSALLAAAWRCQAPPVLVKAAGQ